ncbi:MAG: alanine racemase [Alphaproteobacteria bacterium]
MRCDPTRAGAILTIDLRAIAANWRFLSARVAPADCAAVVKANGYGLGAAPVAQALAKAGCRLFFVATLDEGIALREALGDGIEIAVLNGPFRGTAAEFVAHALIPVLNHPGQIEEWTTRNNARSALRGGEGRDPWRSNGEGEVGLGNCPGIPRLTPTRSNPRGREGAGPPAMLHVDTGMARLGLTPREFSAFLEDRPPIAWRAVISHLACADDPGHPQNAMQRSRFAAVTARFPGVPASLAASSGIFLGAANHFDLVRPGAALYGINPRPNCPSPLRPVVRLAAKIIQTREIDRGEPVGYGAAHVTKAPGRIATVAVGYADGWLRSLSGRGGGYIGDTRVPLLGRASMDLLTFDVSAVDPALTCPGMTIELLGSRYGVDDMAADAGTIGYEILTGLGSRYHRVYRNAPAAATGAR